MIDRLPRKERIAELIFGIALAALFIFALHQSWGMWFEPIVDTGRDLYIPEQIADEGFKLYRDVSYLYPPLAPYLLAVIVSMFGSDLAVMTWVGIITSLLITSLLYLIGRQWSGAAAGVLLAFLFITIHMTGETGFSFNFIFPYSHNATFGLLFILIFLYGLLRYVHDDAAIGWLAVALVAGSFAGWSKIEYAATFLAVLAASFLIRRPGIALIGAAAAVNLILLGVLNWYFSDAPPERHWLTMNILPESLLKGDVASRFYGRLQGLDDPLENLKIAFLGALLITAAVLCLAAIERIYKSGGAVRTIGIPLLVIIFIALQIGLAQQFAFYRGWFLLQWLLIPAAIRWRKTSPLLLLLVFSVILGSRILLRLEPVLYGFVFAIPAEIVFIYVLSAELPRRNVYGRSLALAWVPLFILIGFGSLASQREEYEARRPNLVTTERGSYFDRLPDRAEITNELLSFLERRDPRSMVVVPEGLALNWLAGVETSIPYHTFSPAELPDARSLDAVTDALERHPPELVLLVRRDYGEYGYVGIGVDYGEELIRTIECLYEPAVYRESDRFFLVVMERKKMAECPEGTRPSP